MRKVPDRFFSWLGYCCAVVTGIAVFGALMVGLFILEEGNVNNLSYIVPIFIIFVFISFTTTFIVYLPFAFFSLRLFNGKHSDSKFRCATIGGFQGALPVFGFVLINHVQAAEYSIGSFAVSITLIALAAISGSSASMVYRTVARKEGILVSPSRLRFPK